MRNKTHRIKILSEFADDVLKGQKTFEVRKNDRGYKKGDHVIFEVISRSGVVCQQHPLNYREFEISYILGGWGIKKRYIVLE